MKPRSSILAAAAILALAVAVALRFPELPLRPLHHDEAINALKFAELLETGRYVYDPEEYHGPLLYYLTLAAAKLSGATTFEAIDEWTLRCVPALLGSLLVVLMPPFAQGLGRGAAVAAMFFFAVSPAFTYYSRDYIHEIYFVFFSALAILAGWRYYLNRHAWWFFLAGASLAAMQTTKETYLIAMTVMGLATLMTMAWDRYRPVPRPREAESKPLPVGVLVGTLATAFLISLLLYSSFFRNPRGVLDSLAALLFYFQRTGATSLHDQPWYYYLAILGFTKNLGAPVWSEAFLLALALFGMGIAFLSRSGDENTPLARFLALYSLATFLIYSGLRYKTPWLALNFHFGFILLAAAAVAWLWRRARRKGLRMALAALLAAGTLHLAWQSWQLNFKYPASRRHPYVYAQTVPDLLNLVQRIAEVAAHSPDGRSTPIAVISPEYWPLPFYLRAYDRVGYWHSPPAADLAAPIYITSLVFAQKLESRLGDGYHQEYFGLRPDVPLLLYVRNDLWAAMLEARR
ncbi:TIGR03663 family protein [bacterium]|nr:TIGR03663 family protein [bacterium]